MRALTPQQLHPHSSVSSRQPTTGAGAILGSEGGPRHTSDERSPVGRLERPSPPGSPSVSPGDPGLGHRTCHNQSAQCLGFQTCRASVTRAVRRGSEPRPQDVSITPSGGHRGKCSKTRYSRVPQESGGTQTGSSKTLPKGTRTVTSRLLRRGQGATTPDHWTSSLTQAWLRYPHPTFS